MSKTELTSFMKFLKEELSFTFNIDISSHRMKLQKYVFISQYFGWKNGYEFPIYTRGPFFPRLTDDYHDMESSGIKKSDDSLKNFKYDEFFELTKDKDMEWLETASTMLTLYSDLYENIIKTQKFL